MIRDSVLLTRVGGNNNSFGRDLANISLELLHRPVLKIEPLVPGPACLEVIQNLDLYDHIIFISTNSVIHGLDHLIDRWPQWPAKLKWYAVGDSTASKLRASGIEPVVPEHYSSEGLLALPELEAIENQRVLIVRGLGGRETLKHGLLKRGGLVDYLEVYERHENDWSGEIVSPAEVEKLFASIVYSAESLLIFNQQISDDVRRVPLLVPSDRIAEIARDLGYTSVLAVQPKDDVIVELLAQLRNNKEAGPGT